MTSTTQNPLSLLKGLVSSRNRQAIELANYLEALNILERHFSVYEQRLRVMASPAVFPDGEVLLEAAGQGLEQLRGSVAGLKDIDPATSLDQANALIHTAESGYGLLAQLKEVTTEKREEFVQEYEAAQDDY